MSRENDTERAYRTDYIRNKAEYEKNLETHKKLIVKLRKLDAEAHQIWWDLPIRPDFNFTNERLSAVKDEIQKAIKEQESLVRLIEDRRA